MRWCIGRKSRGFVIIDDMHAAGRLRCVENITLKYLTALVVLSNLPGYNTGVANGT